MAKKSMKTSTVGDLTITAPIIKEAKPIELLTNKPPRAKRGRKPKPDPLVKFSTALHQNEIDQLYAVVEEHNLISVNQLIRFLLQTGVKQIQEGKLTLKTAPPKSALELQ